MFSRSRMDLPTGHVRDELVTSLPGNLGPGGRPSPTDGVRHSHTVWGAGIKVAREDAALSCEILFKGHPCPGGPVEISCRTQPPQATGLVALTWLIAND